jgi:MYXO-CTERM domain-containing protein
MSGITSKSSHLWLVVVVALMFGAASGLHAATFFWNGNGAPGNWNDQNNWVNVGNNQPGIPGPQDEVVIQTVNIANKPTLPSFPVATCSKLTLGNGTLNGGNGTLFVTGEFFINNTATFNAEGATLVFGGNAAQPITSANQRLGNVTIQNTSAAGVTFGGQWVIGDPNNRTTLTVNSGARLTFTANVNLSNTTVVNNGLIRMVAAGNQSLTGGLLPSQDSVNVGNVSFVVNNAGATGTVNGPIRFRDLTFDGAGSGNMTGSVGVAGSLTETLAGSFSMPNAANSILTFLGQTGNPARNFTLNPAVATRQFRCFRMIVGHTATITMSGNFRIHAKGTLNPALLVEAATAATGSVPGRLTLADNTVIEFLETPPNPPLLPSPAESVVRINGWLITNAGPGTSRPLLRSYFPGGEIRPLDKVRMTVGQSGFLDLDGIVLDGFGNASSAYGLVLSDGATINKFDNVSILKSSSVTAVVQLNTGNLPPSEAFNSFEVEASPGGAPRNIDARSIGGFVLYLTAGPVSGNNLYGIAHELDTNNVLSWDSAPTLTISTTSPLNPPATAGSPYLFTMQGSGGNAPYLWTSIGAGNPPVVQITQLVAPTPPAPPPVLYLDPMTGRVSTDPLHRVTNPTGFPGDPGYDPGQEPVVMPSANAGGLYSINFQAEDRSRPIKTATRSITFSVNPAPQPVPQINTFALPDAFEGSPYPANVAISAVNSTPTIPYPNNNPGFVYDISPNSPDPLPAGLTLDANTGVISGTPTFGASQGQPSALYVIEFRVTDILNATAVQQVDIRVFQGVPPLQLGSAAPPNGKVGVPYTFQLNALGGTTPYSWDFGPGSSELPLGLFLGGNGQVGGTPEAGTAADYSIVWRVTDAAGQQRTQSVILRILPPDPPKLVFDTGGSSACAATIGGGHAPWLLVLAALAGLAVLRRRKTA